jgi:hypothetical protein
MLMRRWSGLAALTLLVAALAACSGGGDDEPSSPTATSVGGGSAAAAFTRVLDGLSSAEYRINYVFTTRVGDQDLEGTLIWARAADGRERFETGSQQGDEDFTLVVITDAGGEQVTCFAVSGFDSCFTGDSGPFAEIPNPTEIVFQNVLDPAQIDAVRDAGTRTILGMDTTCYEVEMEAGTTEACIAEGDLLLAASWTGPNGDGGSLEATEFSTSTSEADFERTGPIVN